MIIVKLTGGLGNQLFQYAAAKSLSLHHDVPLLLEVSSFYRDELPDLEVPRDFELYQFKGLTEKIITTEELISVIDTQKEKSITQRILPRHKRNIYTEPFYHYDRNFLNSKKTVLLKGGWQSEKYFEHHRNVIREILQLKDTAVNRVIAKGKELSDVPSVGIHIRRGDYLRKKIIFEWHGVMPREYYIKGFEILKNKLGDLSVYYFTDDPVWVRKELIPVMNGEIISRELSNTHFEDFYLMSQCKHNIIANSSFSWWAAWLNTNPEKIVMAPKNWFNKGPRDTYDLYPAGWLTI